MATPIVSELRSREEQATYDQMDTDLRPRLLAAALQNHGPDLLKISVSFDDVDKGWFTQERFGPDGSHQIYLTRWSLKQGFYKVLATASTVHFIYKA